MVVQRRQIVWIENVIVNSLSKCRSTARECLLAHEGMASKVGSDGKGRTSQMRTAWTSFEVAVSFRGIERRLPCKPLR